MRTEDNPNIEVDWKSFEGVDRNDQQRKSVEDMGDVIPVSYSGSQTQFSSTKKT